MYNYFINIWKIIIDWMSHVQVKTWQLIGSIVALIALSYFFICIHQINRIGVEYHVMEVRGLSAKGGSAKLDIRINNGLLFERDEKESNYIHIEHNFDPKLERLGEQNRLWLGEPKDDEYKYSSMDSLFNIYGLGSINDNNKHIYRVDKKISQYSRAHCGTQKLHNNALFYEDSLKFNISEITPLVSQFKNIITSKRIATLREYAIQKAPNLTEFTSYTHLWNNSLNSFPKITTPWDISQRSYKINYYSDGYDINFRHKTNKEEVSKQNIRRYRNGNINQIYSTDCETIGDSIIQYSYVPKVTKNNEELFQPTTPLKELKVDFGGPTEFLAMYPEPDLITVSGFIFTDSLKLRQIMSDGIEFHAKFPQTESLQNARMFVVTTLISILISVIFTLCYKIARAKYINWGRNRQKKNNSNSKSNSKE